MLMECVVSSSVGLFEHSFIAVWTLNCVTNSNVDEELQVLTGNRQVSCFEFDVEL